MPPFRVAGLIGVVMVEDLRVHSMGELEMLADLALHEMEREAQLRSLEIGFCDEPICEGLDSEIKDRGEAGTLAGSAGGACGNVHRLANVCPIAKAIV